MVFDTFLNYFELRTGCFVVTILYMCYIILCLHGALKTNFKTHYVFDLVSLIEKLCETVVTLLLIYAVFKVTSIY